MKVRFVRLHPDAILPRYATPGAACFDLASIESGTVPAHGSRVFGVGLAFEVPDDHVLLIFSRSGHGFKNGLRLANSVGVLDSDYRGGLLVSIHNDRAVGFDIKSGDRIAQGMILPVPRVEFEEVDRLSETERGDDGFGSTG